MTLAALLATSAFAAPAALHFVAQAHTNADTRVIDVRTENACAQASLPGARCLPATELFSADGAPVSFHVLRWLLGTIGLNGSERVVVVADNMADAAVVGSLLLIAGQREVAVLDRAVAIPTDASGGTPRSMTRETVFTTPMRDRLLVVGNETGDNAIDTGRPYDRLRAFARRYAEDAPTPQLQLMP
ncbi:MAG TPA: rhodanese-like domain-containing protein [Pseudolabrys sp.]|nr:rhodanese-like domain-containing protein [Pseudolabrys sp.]